MKKFYALLSLFFLLAGVACSGFEEPIPMQAEDVGNGDAVTSARTRSGGDSTFETLANPYALDVMQTVYDTHGSGHTVLQPTDLYVRFLPQDSLQLNRLEDEYNLDLFDYPLDLDIPDGEEYVDPTIPDGEFTWQYAVVDAGFVFPEGLVYEILEECYIPEDGETIPSATRGEDVDVETAAIEMLGYVVDSEPLTRSAAYPQGQVTVWDDSRSRYEPVKGVRVKCRYFVKISNTYTDESGRYTSNKKFRVRPYYTVVFKNVKDFIIWEGMGNRAKYNVGQHGKTGYDIVIDKTIVNVWPGISFVNEGWQWAAINNAAYDYYRMCETTGISKPPSGLRILVWGKGSSAPMIRRFSVVRLYATSEWGRFFGVLGGLAGPVILDGLFKFLEPDVTIDNREETYRDFYYVVNHELGHASHFSKADKSYWAKYVGHIIDSSIYYGTPYGYRTDTYGGICEVGEMWGYAMGHINECENYEDIQRLSNPYRFRPPSGSWIRPDPVWALITRGVLTKKQIYDCLTSDVDTRDKLINRMCSKYPAKAGFIRAAFQDNDVIIPTVTGPARPARDAQVVYTITDNLPPSVVFSGWTINSRRYEANDLGNPVLNIKFIEGGAFVITANFTLLTMFLIVLPRR